MRSLLFAGEDVDVGTVSSIKFNSESGPVRLHSIYFSSKLADTPFCHRRIKTTSFQPTLSSTLSVVEVLEFWMTFGAASLPGTRIMCPYTPLPGSAADEVGMILGDTAIVNGFYCAAVANRLDRHRLAIVATQTVADLQKISRRPALVPHVERVFRRGSDCSPVHLNMPDPAGRDNQLTFTM